MTTLQWLHDHTYPLLNLQQKNERKTSLLHFSYVEGEQMQFRKSQPALQLQASDHQITVSLRVQEQLKPDFLPDHSW